MATTTDKREIKTLVFIQETSIAAPIEITFQAILEELGPGSVMQDGKPFPMNIEARPGGRWYRDLGNDSGHLWGHVQVIKPPTRLELNGPMFMSYPAVNFVQYRLTPGAGGTQLKFVHQAFGWIPTEVLEGVTTGWQHGLKRIRELSERRSTRGK